MKKILIVDDDENYLFQISALLEDFYKVITAKSQEEAKSKIKGINLAIVDIVLNEKEENNKEGLELLKWIKENHNEIPVIIMSGYKDFSMAVEALNLGAVYFLRKPYKDKNVLEKVKKYIK